MRRHPYGTAVYEPLPYTLFHPGSVGYFDSTGSWNPITDLFDEINLQSDEFTPVEKLQREPTDTSSEWRRKLLRMLNRERQISGGIDPGLATVLPADVSAHVKFSTSTAGGALLLTTPPMRHERYYYESPFKHWVHENAGQLLKMREEIFEYGLWIVTSTWATEECAIHVWDDRSKEVDVGFNASITAAGELGPAGGWTVGGKDGGGLGIG